MVGIPLWVALLILGGLTTLYTVFGGMKAVIWTDVMQFFVLMGGAIAVLVGVAMAFHWHLGAIWHTASHPPPGPVPWLAGKSDTVNHTRLVSFGPGIYEMSIWIVMISTFLQVVGSYGSDQVLVQRYLATGSRKQMTASLIGGGLLTLPVNVILYGTGVFLVAYYHHFLHAPGHAWVGKLTNPNEVMTDFLSHGLTSSMGAIVIAGLFAGTMSSFSAGLNSLSTATYVDFLTRLGRKDKTEHRGVLHAKLVTFAWGLVIITGARLIGVGEKQDTIMKILNEVMSPFAGPLLGMFLLGMLSRRANGFGVIAGAAVGLVATVCVIRYTEIHWLWYPVVGTLGGLVAGYILSLVAGCFWSDPPSATDEQHGFEVISDAGSTTELQNAQPTAGSVGGETETSI